MCVLVGLLLALQLVERYTAKAARLTSAACMQRWLSAPRTAMHASLRAGTNIKGCLAMELLYSTWSYCTAHGVTVQHMELLYSTWSYCTAHGVTVQHMELLYSTGPAWQRTWMRSWCLDMTA
jgi:hypothetical protein